MAAPPAAGTASTLTDKSVLVTKILNPLQKGITLLKSAARTLHAEGIQAELAAAAVSLPKIAVCGFQSTGKSTCLEMIAGVGTLLPKDDAICTTCPCVISLMHDPDCPRPVAVFPEHAESGRKACRFAEADFAGGVWREIAARQPAKVGGQVRVSRTPVLLEVHWAQYAVDLVLVDLPGIRSSETQSVEADAAQKIQLMYEDQLGNPNCIILVVERVEVLGTNPGGCVGAGMAVKYDTNWELYKKWCKHSGDAKLPAGYSPGVEQYESRVVGVMSNFKSPCMDQSQWGGPLRPSAFEGVMKLLKGEGELPCRNGWYVLRWLPRWQEDRGKGKEVTLALQHESELEWFKRGADPGRYDAGEAPPPFSQYNPKTMWPMVLEAQHEAAREAEAKQAAAGEDGGAGGAGGAGGGGVVGPTLGARALTGRLGTMLDRFIRRSLPRYPPQLTRWVAWADRCLACWTRLSQDASLDAAAGDAIGQYCATLRGFLGDDAASEGVRLGVRSTERDRLDAIVARIRNARRLELVNRLDEVELFASDDGRRWGDLKLLLQAQSRYGVRDWKRRDPELVGFVGALIAASKGAVERVVRAQLDRVCDALGDLIDAVRPEGIDMFAQLLAFVRAQGRALMRAQRDAAMEFVRAHLDTLVRDVRALLESRAATATAPTSTATGTGTGTGAGAGAAEAKGGEGEKQQTGAGGLGGFGAEADVAAAAAWEDPDKTWPDAVIEGRVHLTADTGAPRRYWAVLCGSDARLRFFDTKDDARAAYAAGRGGTIGRMRRFFRLRFATVEHIPAPKGSSSSSSSSSSGGGVSRVKMWQQAHPECATVLAWTSPALCERWFTVLLLTAQGVRVEPAGHGTATAARGGRGGGKGGGGSEGVALDATGRPLAPSAQALFRDFARAQSEFVKARGKLEQCMETVRRAYNQSSDPGAGKRKVAELTQQLRADPAALDDAELPLARRLGQLTREARRAEATWRQVEEFQKDPHAEELVSKLEYIKASANRGFGILKRRLESLAPEAAVLGMLLQPFMLLRAQADAQARAQEKGGEGKEGEGEGEGEGGGNKRSLEGYVHARLDDAVRRSVASLGGGTAGDSAPAAVRAAALRSMLVFGGAETAAAAKAVKASGVSAGGTTDAGGGSGGGKKAVGIPRRRIEAVCAHVTEAKAALETAMQAVRDEMMEATGPFSREVMQADLGL